MVTHGPLSEVFDPLSFGFDGSDIMFLISRQSDPSLFLAPDANIVVILVWAVSYTSSVVPGGGGGQTSSLDQRTDPYGSARFPRSQSFQG